MPSYKLVYFNVKARAEPARYLFSIAGVKYEDKRVAGEEWGKLKAETTLGQLPILYVDDKELPQSRAINRYLARELGFFGSNSWENARVDVISETIDEVWPSCFKIFMEKDDTKKDELRNKLADEELPKVTAKLNTLLKQNKNGGGWFVGNKISLADIAVCSALVDFLPAVTKRSEVNLTGSEALKGLISRFTSHPKVAEWIKNRPKTDM